MFFNQAKQDGMQIFEGILFFKATNNTKINHLAAVSCVLLEGLCAHTILQEAVFPEAPNWQQLLVSFCIVHGFEDEDSLQNSHSVLFCLIKKHFV